MRRVASPLLRTLGWVATAGAILGPISLWTGTRPDLAARPDDWPGGARFVFSTPDHMQNISIEPDAGFEITRLHGPRFGIGF